MTKKFVWLLLLVFLLPNISYAAGFMWWRFGADGSKTTVSPAYACQLIGTTWVAKSGLTWGQCADGYVIAKIELCNGPIERWNTLTNTCVTSCPSGTEVVMWGEFWGNCYADCVTGSYELNSLGELICPLPPCTAGEVKEGYAPTSGTQRYDNCNYELNPNEPSKEIYSGVSTGTHGTWINTGTSNPGDNTLIVPGSPETPCEGLDCCLDMTEGQGYEGELAFLYCEEFWTEEDKSTESYYKY